MILLSVAHSLAQNGACNEKFGLKEYQVSQLMTNSCREFLQSHKVETDVLDVGNMRNYRTFKKKYVNNLRPEIAIEIHLNSGPKSAKYHSCFYDKDNKTAKRASEIILHNLSVAFEPYGWGTIQNIGVPAPNWPNERYGFILNTKPNAALIVEPLFVSNDQQAEWLSKSGAPESIGVLVAEGILQWKLEKTKSSQH